MFSEVFKKHEETDRSESETRTTQKPTATERKSMGSSSGAFLSEDVEFKGTLVFTSELELNAKFEGEIIADGPLVIGSSAVIKGDIKAKSTVLLKGKMQGNIEAQDRVEVAGSAHLYGDVKAPKFSLQEGAVFVGSTDTAAGKKESGFQSMFSKLGKSDSGSALSASSGTSTASGSHEPEKSG